MKRALIFFGGWAGHQPREGAEFFADRLGARGFSVELRDSLACLDDPGARLAVGVGVFAVDQFIGRLDHPGLL